MIIETERLRIRDLRPEDATSIADMASDGSLMDVGFDRDCSAWIDGWIEDARHMTRADDPRTDYLAYGVSHAQTGEFLGSVGVSFYPDLNKVGITYFLGAQFRGNGYATEMVRAYTSYFLTHYDVPELIATIRQDNAPSWRVIEKVGFALQGCRMYRDVNDDCEKLYRFYILHK